MPEANNIFDKIGDLVARYPWLNPWGGLAIAALILAVLVAFGVVSWRIRRAFDHRKIKAHLESERLELIQISRQFFHAGVFFGSADRYYRLRVRDTRDGSVHTTTAKTRRFGSVYLGSRELVRSGPPQSPPKSKPKSRPESASQTKELDQLKAENQRLRAEIANLKGDDVREKL